MRVQRPSCRPRVAGPVAIAMLGLLLLSGCSGDVDEGDLIDQTVDVTRGLSGMFQDSAAPRPQLQIPSSEGRPYPNLASVPGKPTRVLAQVREGEIAALNRDRDAAEERESGLRRGIVGQQSGDREGRFVGSVVADSIGAFSANDDRVLRRAVEMAGAQGTSRIRLAGDARATLAAADRLTRLGFDRGRIDVTPTPETPGGRQAVEITVARNASGR